MISDMDTKKLLKQLARAYASMTEVTISSRSGPIFALIGNAWRCDLHTNAHKPGKDRSAHFLELLRTAARGRGPTRGFEGSGGLIAAQNLVSGSSPDRPTLESFRRKP